MPFQFYCPQGHVLQGDESQVGQPCQCPYCGSSFLIPQTSMPTAPQQGPAGYPQGPMQWPNPMGGGFPQQGFQPAPGMQSMQGMQGMQGMPPNNPFLAGMPGGMPPGGMGQPGVAPMQPAQGAAFGLPPPQPFALGPSGEAPPSPAAAGSPPTEDSGLILSFDPKEKEPLPFEMPGSDTAPAMPASGPAIPLDPFAASPLPMQFPGLGSPLMPQSPQPAPVVPTSSQSAHEKPAMADITQGEAKKIHVTCPAGHSLKVSSDLISKTVRCPVCKEQFKVRYEDSVEFGQRKAKMLQQKDEKAGQIWLAWAILAAVGVLVGLIVLMFMFSS